MKFFLLMTGILLSPFFINAQNFNSSANLYYSYGDTVTVTGSGFNEDEAFVALRIGFNSVKLIESDSNYLRFLAPASVYYGKLIYTDISLKKSIVSPFDIFINDGISSSNDFGKIFRSPVNIEFSDGADYFSGIYFADMNQDGRMELISGSSSKGSTVYTTKGVVADSVFGFGADARLRNICDFDMDGRLDLLIDSGIQRKIFLNRSNKDTFRFLATRGFLPFESFLGAGSLKILIDFNGDGRGDQLDLLRDGSTDSTICLNLADTGVYGFKLKKIPSVQILGTNSPSSGAFKTIDLNGDNRTDLIYRYRDSSNAMVFMLLLNQSTSSNIAFKKIDTLVGIDADYSIQYNFNESLDFDKDGINEHFWFNLYQSTNYNNGFGAMFRKEIDTAGIKLSFVQPKNGLSEIGATYILDHDFDGIPELCFSSGDSMFMAKVNLNGDSVSYQLYKIKGATRGMADINHDNIPDLIRDNTSPPMVYLGETGSFVTDEQSILHSPTDSNQIMYDSVKIRITTIGRIFIDSLKSRRGVKFYSSSSYTHLLVNGIKADRDTVIQLYFAYQYKQDTRDTLRMMFGSEDTDFLELRIKKREAFARIDSFSKYFAVPGDTVFLHGRNLYSSIENVSLRIYNRRCTILNTSSDSMLAFIYPALTPAGPVSLIDSSRKRHIYSTEVLYPAYKMDSLSGLDSSSFDRDLPLYYSNVNYTYMPNYFNTFEMPEGQTTGNLLAPQQCILDTLMDYYMPFGSFKLKRYHGVSDYLGLHMKMSEDLYMKLGNSDISFMNDLNGDGLLDNVSLHDSMKVHFCEAVKEDEIVYQKAYIQTPFAWFNYYDTTGINVFNQVEDIDNDGRLDFLAFNFYDPDQFFRYNYDQSSGTFVFIDSSRFFSKAKASSILFKDLNRDGLPEMVNFYMTNDTLSFEAYLNLSRHGEIRFDKTPYKFLNYLPVVKGYGNGLTVRDINNDRWPELFVSHQDPITYLSTMYVYTYDLSKEGHYVFLDSFNFEGFSYDFKDINNDAKPELFANKIYQMEMFNDSLSVNVCRMGAMYGGNIGAAQLMDFNGDKLVDFFDGQTVHYNKAQAVRFGFDKVFSIETDSFSLESNKSFWIYNLGAKDVQIDSIMFDDPAFYVGLNDSLNDASKVRMKKGDSLLVTISFKPFGNKLKSYSKRCSIRFRENNYQLSFEVKGTVRLVPRIHAVMPSFYAVGDTILIKGKFFDNGRSQPVLSFEDARAEILSFNDSMIVLIAPRGCNSGKITLRDTTTNLYAVSPFHTQYYFIGSNNSINANTFSIEAVSGLSGSCQLYDHNHDGLMDWEAGQALTLNRSIPDSFVFERRSQGEDRVLALEADNIPGISLAEGPVYTRAYTIFPRWYLSFVNGRYGYSWVINSLSYRVGGQCVNDINGNGMPEINFGMADASTAFFEFNPDNNVVMNCEELLPQHQISTSYDSQFNGKMLQTIDFDGDGLAELFYLDTVPKIAFNLSSKSVYSKSQALRLNLDSIKSYKFRDMDLDGKIDIVGLKFLTNTESEWFVFKNTSRKDSLSFSLFRDTLERPSYALHFEAEDFNGDAKPDLFVNKGNASDSFFFVTNTSSSSVISFENPVGYFIPNNLSGIKAGDADGDGKIDVFVNTTGGLYILKNKAISGYLSRTRYSGSSLFGSSMTMDLAIYSDGGDTLRINKINLPPGYRLVNSSGLFRMGAGAGLSFPIIISPGDSFNIQLVNDSLLAPGEYSDKVEFFNNESKKPYILTIKREILKGPLLKADTDVLDFGKHRMQQVGSKKIKVWNAGNDTLRINAIKLSDSTEFKLIAFGKTKLAPEDTVELEIAYQSRKYGLYDERLYIFHNAFDSLTGIMISHLVISPKLPDSLIVKMDSTSVGKNSSKGYTIINSGTDTLDLSNSFNYTGIDFSVELENKFLMKVPPSDSFRIKVTFAPQSFGDANESYLYSYNNNLLRFKINMTGFGFGAEMNLNSHAVNLGNVRRRVNTTFKLNYKNTGNRPLRIDSVRSLRQSLTPLNCTLSNILAPGDSSYICFSIQAEARGLFKDTLEILSNDRDSVQRIICSAWVIQAVPELLQKPDTLKEFVHQWIIESIMVKNSGDDTLFNASLLLGKPGTVASKVINNTTGWILPGASQEFKLSFNPEDTIDVLEYPVMRSTYDTTVFSDPIRLLGLNAILQEEPVLELSSKIGQITSANYYIKNRGNFKVSNLKVSNLLSEFRYLPSETIIDEGDSIVVAVEFKPLIYQMWRTDTLYLEGDVDSFSVRQKYVIRAKVRYPEISLSMQSISFGDVKLGEQGSVNLEIFNFGDDTLNCQLLSPEGYALSKDQFFIEQGKSEMIKVFFEPNEVKTYYDSIRVLNNSAVSNFTVPVTGIGRFNTDSVSLEYEVQSLNFGDVYIGDSLSKNLTVFNKGNQNLELMFSTDDPVFKLSTDTFVEIKVAESFDLSVKFLPNVKKTYSGNLKVLSRYNDSLGTVLLTGKGNTTGVNHPFFANIMVYPIPSDQLLQLTGLAEATSIKVFSTQGQLLESFEDREGGRFLINTSEWEDGMYLLEFTCGDKMHAIKISVVH